METKNSAVTRAIAAGYRPSFSKSRRMSTSLVKKTHGGLFVRALAAHGRSSCGIGTVVQTDGLKLTRDRAIVPHLGKLNKGEELMLAAGWLAFSPAGESVSGATGRSFSTRREAGEALLAYLPDWMATK